MPENRDRADHPAIQAAARLPAYIALSLVIVALTAGGLLAARGPANDRDGVVAGDVAETPLPTPVPLETGTPLPTPLGTLDRASIVDTAVAFWVAWIPDEVAQEFRAAIAAASAVGSRSTVSTPAASTPSPHVGSATPQPSDQPAGDGLVSVPAVTVPLPTAMETIAPSIPLPSVPLPVPTPTLPPLLP